MSQTGWTSGMLTAIPAADPTDVMGRRVAAKIIDLIIAGIIGSLGLLTILHSFHSRTVTDAIDYCDQVRTAHHVCMPVGTTGVWEYNQPTPLAYLPGIVWWLVIAWLEGFTGWTPGKLLLGLRVMRSKTGRVCGFGPSLVRNLLWIVDGMCFAIVGFFVAMRSPGHRRLGDHAASTLVVDKAAMGTIPTIAGVTQPTVGAPMGAALPQDAPIWDHARNTYILWDSTRQVWLEWNAASNAWQPIST